MELSSPVEIRTEIRGACSRRAYLGELIKPHEAIRNRDGASVPSPCRQLGRSPLKLSARTRMLSPKPIAPSGLSQNPFVKPEGRMGSRVAAHHAALRFLVRHLIRTVECSTIHCQSGSVKATGRAPTVGPVHFMEVPFHLCTRARPSQNEKPQALLWNVAG
jgi:hypothetical protein